MAESNPMRWVVLAFIAAGLFAVGLVTMVDRQVDAAKAKATAEAQEMDQRMARADQQVTSGLDRAATVAAPFIAEIGAARFADAYARLADPYRAAVSLAAFTETCKRSPILMAARQVTLRRVRTLSGGGGATLEADGLLDSTAGAVPISFLQEPAGPRILVVSLAGVPLLQGVTPGR